MTYYLMVKKAYPSGLFYLCQTSKQDPIKYKGSGRRWLNHIGKHKPRIITCILGQFETHEELKEAGIYYSRLYNVVESEEWANLREEDGMGGGRGKIGRTWKIRDTSKMKGSKDRTTDRCKAGYRRVAEKMSGDNNPSRRFPITEKQRDAARRQSKIATLASMKSIRVFYPDGTQEDFESKRQVCYKLGITYDILNYRLSKNLDLNGTRFEEVK